ncbi:MAG: heavy-metal-associated domain-containing protein [Selenomonadaceae bacterium]|nr:heavy-metal-associated domain-containing protein [Selenomonadaceae bacterium]
MVATIVLGILIAAALGYALRTMYRSFFKGEAACCSESCSSCSAGCNSSMQKALDEGYRARVEKIEKMAMRGTIDVDGMTCEKCIYKVIKALEKIDGVKIAAASLEKQSAEIGLTHEVDENLLRETLRKAGYSAGSVTLN